MIKEITLSDRKKNPAGTKGKKYKLISRSTGKILGYGTINYLKKRERQIQFFKRKTG
ncbi:MAG TPA: hypothetical protein VII99_13220 [Bacteroidia bacterium]